MKQADRRFIPRQMLAHLGKESVSELQLNDYVRLEMTVLFSDIRSFTTLSEQLAPEETLRFLNDYLSRMEPSVEQYGGFIDKFMGDSIMALFSTGADAAVQSALHMFTSLRDYNLERLRAGFEPIRIGIGLNSGPLLLGIVGGVARLQATVVGDAVNVASRIEDLNKLYGTSLLLTGHTVERLKDASDYALRHIDTVQVRGRSRKERIYELFDADDPFIREKKLETKQAFEEARMLYEAGSFAEAKSAFQAVSASNRFDLVSRVYMERCDHPPRMDDGALVSAAVPDTLLDSEDGELAFTTMLAEPSEPSLGATPVEVPPSAPVIFDRFMEVARHYFTQYLGVTLSEEVIVEWVPHAELHELTACVFLQGALDGGLCCSIDIEGALRLLHRMSYGSWSAADEIPLLLDALGESLNTIAGQSLRMFQHFADFATIGSPIVKRTGGKLLSPPGGAWCATFRFGEVQIKLATLSDHPKI